MIQVGKTEVYFVDLKGERKELTPEEAEELYQALKVALGKVDTVIYPTSPWIPPPAPPQPPIMWPPDYPFDRPWTSPPTVTD